jgi:nucleotide-binding universal stress UspA family protein
MSTVGGTRCSVFDRIVCPVDASSASLEAARQAGRLRSDGATIDLVGFVEVDATDYSIYGAPETRSEAEVSMGRQLAEARALCPGASSELLHGPTVERLVELIAESNPTLVAVGASTHRRSVGMIRRNVATEMLHRADSSVLVARAKSPTNSFPSSVAVGYDGSAAAEAALDAGRDIAERFGANLRVIAAGEAAGIESGSLADITVERDERDALAALVDASTHADLVVVGSRGLRGVRALGSVSERLGHRAACSVLVVRGEPT